MVTKTNYKLLSEEVENINFLLSLGVEIPANYLDSIKKDICTFNKLYNDYEKTFVKSYGIYDIEIRIAEQLNIYHKEINKKNINVKKINNIYNKLIIKRKELIKYSPHKDYLSYYKSINYNGLVINKFSPYIDSVVDCYINELKSFYKKINSNNKVNIHPYDLDKVRTNNTKHNIDFEQDVLSNIIKMDIDFYKYLKKLYLEGFIYIINSETQEGFFIELPYSKKGSIYLECIGDIDDYFNLIHEVGHLYHHFITTYVNPKNRCTSLEIKELVAHAFESIFVRTYSSKEIRDIYEIQQKSSVLWNVVLFEFQNRIYNNPEKYLSIGQKNEFFIKLLKKYTHYYLENGNQYDELLENTWMLESMLFETPFYNLEYIYAQVNAVDILNNNTLTLDELKRLFKNGNNIDVKLLKLYMFRS